MKSLRAEDDNLEDVEEFLATRKNLRHLRAHRRANCIILTTGPTDLPRSCARLRRISVHRWTLDMPDHRGRWEATPYEDALEPLLAFLVKSFSWALTPEGP